MDPKQQNSFGRLSLVWPSEHLSNSYYIATAKVEPKIKNGHFFIISSVKKKKQHLEAPLI